MLVRVLRSNRNGLSSTLLIYFRTARVDGIRVVSYLVIRKDYYSEAVSHSGDFFLFLNRKGGVVRVWSHHHPDTWNLDLISSGTSFDYSKRSVQKQSIINYYLLAIAVPALVTLPNLHGLLHRERSTTVPCTFPNEKGGWLQ